MYVQFANADFMKNTLFANNKTWNIYFLRFLWVNFRRRIRDKHSDETIFSQLMLLFFYAQ